MNLKRFAEYVFYVDIAVALLFYPSAMLGPLSLFYYFPILPGALVFNLIFVIRIAVDVKIAKKYRILSLLFLLIILGLGFYYLQLFMSLGAM
jgi:hypothetical protein